jgi:hypothetical protein
MGNYPYCTPRNNVTTKGMTNIKDFTEIIVSKAVVKNTDISQERYGNKEIPIINFNMDTTDIAITRPSRAP